MFVLKDLNKEKNQTLANYYIYTYKHLVPDNVELWEYEESKKSAERLI